MLSSTSLFPPTNWRQIYTLRDSVNLRERDTAPVKFQFFLTTLAETDTPDVSDQVGCGLSGFAEN